MSKILSASELSAARDALAAKGRRLVFTNGCFDILHAGHVRYLRQARELGDALAVGLNGDGSVRALKGPGRPVNGEADRAEVLAALECVDYVTIFPGERITALARAVRPHVYAKGGDYTVESLNPEEAAALREGGSEIRILPLVPGRSTTAILKRSAVRLGVLGSGKGSNFAAIQREIEQGRLRAETAVVLSDVEAAPILDLARERGIKAVFVPPGRFRTKLEPEAENAIVEILKEAKVDLVVLAGFMRMLKEPMLAAFPRRIINIHPSLLPKFPGMEAWKQALASGESVTGCTVHYVDAGMDSGEIIAQREVPILPGDTAETLHARIQAQEHALYPEVLSKLAHAAL